MCRIFKIPVAEEHGHKVSQDSRRRVRMEQHGRYQWRDFVTITDRKVIGCQNGQNSGRTRGRRDPLRGSDRFLVLARLLIQDSQLHVCRHVGWSDSGHMRVGINGLEAVPKRTIQFAETTVGLDILGTKRQSSAK